MYRTGGSQLLQCAIWRSWAACEILSNCMCAETQSAALWVLVSLPKKAKLMQSEKAFPACQCQINQKPHKTSTLFSNYNSLLSFIREILHMFCKSTCPYSLKRVDLISILTVMSLWWKERKLDPKAREKQCGTAVWDFEKQLKENANAWKEQPKTECGEVGQWEAVGHLSNRAWQWSERRSSMETACSHSVAH